LVCMSHHTPTSLFTFLFFFSSSGDHRDLHSFPTRRSSDLDGDRPDAAQDDRRRRRRHGGWLRDGRDQPDRPERPARAVPAQAGRDRKSTRLNSSHVKISYAVFCLKKKKKIKKKNKKIKKNK